MGAQVHVWCNAPENNWTLTLTPNCIIWYSVYYGIILSVTIWALYGFVAPAAPDRLAHYKSFIPSAILLPELEPPTTPAPPAAPAGNPGVCSPSAVPFAMARTSARARDWRGPGGGGHRSFKLHPLQEAVIAKDPSGFQALAALSLSEVAHVHGGGFSGAFGVTVSQVS